MSHTLCRPTFLGRAASVLGAAAAKRPITTSSIPRSAASVSFSNKLGLPLPEPIRLTPRLRNPNPAINVALHHNPAIVSSSSKIFHRQLHSYYHSSTSSFQQLDPLSGTMSPTKEYALLCLENPLLDIQAVGNDDLLKKYDLKANDAILAEDKHLPLYEDLLNNYDAKLLAGGAAQNSARGAQYMLPPNSVVYIGGVGDDKYAAILHDAVRAVGLRVEYRVDPKVPTGRCGVVITGHNRSLCTALGAANHYDLDHLKKPEIWSLAENAEVIYVGGYHFTVCPPAIMELGKLAAEKNKVFALNLSAPFIAQFFKDVVDASSPYWDYIIGNETEVAAYAESHSLPSSAPRDVALHLANLPKANAQRKRVAVVTQGTEPTLVAVQGEAEVREIPVHAIEKEKINDTNGAGDAFAGGFLAGLVQGKPLETAVDMGQWLARLSIQELGPSYPSPKQTYTS